MFVVSISFLATKIMKMSENEGPEFVLELEDDDEVLFDDVNDYDC